MNDFEAALQYFRELTAGAVALCFYPSDRETWTVSARANGAVAVMRDARDLASAIRKVADLVQQDLLEMRGRTA